jgi:hypothetical protein
MRLCFGFCSSFSRLRSLSRDFIKLMLKIKIFQYEMHIFQIAWFFWGEHELVGTCGSDVMGMNDAHLGLDIDVEQPQIVVFSSSLVLKLLYFILVLLQLVVV